MTHLCAALAAFAEQPGGGLITLPTAINNFARKRIFSLAARLRLPAVYPFRHHAADGGLMSYSASSYFHETATYVDKFLKGAKPADLPVSFPSRFVLIVNLKSAKSLGLTIAPTMIARADEVIE